MSVTVRSPIVARKTRRREALEGSCWEESVCSGDKLINEHASRISWWLTAVFVVVALVLVGVIMQNTYKNATTGPFSLMTASSWIQPTPRALASLVGIAVVLDTYTSYMIALKKGHLDKYVGQFVLSTFLKIGFWVLFVEGIRVGATIGSFFALIGLALMLGWSFLTSHSATLIYSLLHALLFAFVIFLIVWIATSNVVIWPSA